MSINRQIFRLWPFLAMAALLTLQLSAGLAAAREPLLMPGKTSLYQRVLTRPGAGLHDGVDGALIAEQPVAFSVLYVFARADGWVEVGPEFGGDATGWIPESQVVDWKQTIVVAFTNPADRERSLLFDDHSTIEEILNSEDFVAQLAALRGQAIAETLPPDTPVRSIEPDKHVHVDIEDSFYLLPILNHTQILNPLNYEELQILEVAVVPANAELPQAPAPASEGDEFRAGVMFVIDTTRSMGPYIELTRNAVGRIMAKLQESDLGRRIDFGLVGFRDSVEAAPDLDYVTRTFLPLAPDQDPAEVIGRLDLVEEATANSPGFNEDVLAGFNAVLDDEIWKPYKARYVVLITDAGPKLGEKSSLGSLANSAALGRQASEELRIGTYVMHLRSSAGAGTHNYAEAEYLKLAPSTTSDPGSRYYPITDGTEEAFAPAIDGFVEGVRNALEDPDSLTERIEETEPGMIRDIYADTLAMRLAYLGAREGEQVPIVFRAWISQRVLEDTNKNALDVRLLITKDELNTLSEVLRNIVDSAGGEDRDSTEFFGQLRSALAAMTRDPSLVVNTQFETLGEAFGEFLEDLPYRSPLLQMSEERWINLSPDKQFEFLRTLEAKIRHFDRVHNTPERWTQLHPSSPPGAHVYPMPLDYMP